MTAKTNSLLMSGFMNEEYIFIMSGDRFEAFFFNSWQLLSNTLKSVIIINRGSEAEASLITELSVLQSSKNETAQDLFISKARQCKKTFLVLASK